MKHIKYTKQMLQEAVDKSTSVMQVLEHLGLAKAGGTHSHISKKIKEYELDTSHFLGQGHNKGKVAQNRRTPQEILVVRPAGSSKEKTAPLRRALLELGVEHKCSECSLGNIWNNKPITLEVDHVDGDWLNNSIDNLRFLCPNCHSQQLTTNMPHKFR